MIFKKFLILKEESLNQPHVIDADPPLILPPFIRRLSDILKRGKEVVVFKQIDPNGGEKDVTLKSKKLYVTDLCVANYLLGRSSKDIELVTDAHPEEIVKICENINPPFLCKREKDYVKVFSGRREEKVYSLKDFSSNKGEYTVDLKKNAYSKDFTIECLYYDINADKIIDPLGGIAHLRDGEIKPTQDKSVIIARNPLVGFKYAGLLASLNNSNNSNIKQFANIDISEISKEKIKDALMKNLDIEYVNYIKYFNFLKDLGLLSIFDGLEVDIPEEFFNKTKPVVFASLLKNNSLSDVSVKLKELKFNQREINDIMYLLNLIHYKNEPWIKKEFKARLVTTSLTKKQIYDWAKYNKIDKNYVDGIFDEHDYIKF